LRFAINNPTVTVAGAVFVSVFYVNDIGSTGSRGRTRGIPCIYPPAP